MGLRKNETYFEDITILHRVGAVRWERGIIDNGSSASGTKISPGPRAYHTITSLSDGRVLVVGGFNGRVSMGDAWWLTHLESKSLPNDINNGTRTVNGTDASISTAANILGSSSNTFLRALGITKATPTNLSNSFKTVGINGSREQNFEESNINSRTPNPNHEFSEERDDDN